MASTPLTKTATPRLRFRTVFQRERPLVDFDRCLIAMPNIPLNTIYNTDAAEKEVKNGMRCAATSELRSNAIHYQMGWLHQNRHHKWTLEHNASAISDPVSALDILFEENTYGFRSANQNFHSFHSFFFDGDDLLDNKECLELTALGVSFDDLFMLEPDYV